MASSPSKKSHKGKPKAKVKHKGTNSTIKETQGDSGSKRKTKSNSTAKGTMAKGTSTQDHSGSNKSRSAKKSAEYYAKYVVILLFTSYLS